MKIKNIWNFILYDNSLLSWIIRIIVIIILSYICVQLLIGPIMESVLGETKYYVFGGVQGRSMEHHGFDFDEWWDNKKEWYVENNISKDNFDNFSMKNGIDRGDMIILENSNNINVGDVIVFRGNYSTLLIHRVVKKWEEKGKSYYQAKGDYNYNYSAELGEDNLSEDDITGKVVFKIPISYFRKASETYERIHMEISWHTTVFFCEKIKGRNFKKENPGHPCDFLNNLYFRARVFMEFFFTNFFEHNILFYKSFK